MEMTGLQIILLPFGFFMFSSIAQNIFPHHETQTEEKIHCKVEEINERKSLNCSHQNLTFIPKTGSSIQTLIFEYNYLTNVTSETFRNISNPNDLIDLELEHNNIQNISSGALDIFPNLKFLYLSYNPIYYDNLKNLLGALSSFKFLSHLAISGIRTITVKADLFSLMKENRIETLDVEFYCMKTVSMGTFGNFNRLRAIYLRDNHIKDILLFRNTLLNTLYIDHNNINTFPDFSIEGNESNCYFPNLESLNVRHNEIKELRSDNFKCLRRLKNLKLGENFITVLQNNFLSKLQNIYDLRLKFLITGSLRVEPFAFNSTSLSNLKLEFGRPAADVFASFKDTFKFSLNLKSLRLGRISMLLLTRQQFYELFSPLNNLKLFDCFSCQIMQDPKVLLNYLKNVNVVRLESNLISSLSDETFKGNKKITYLSLRYNQLGHIHESALPVSLLNKLRILDLSKNPFVCDCDLEWLIKWMKTKQNKNVLQRYPQEYICSLPKERSGMRLSDVSFTYKECHPWSPWIWVAIIASPCGIFIAIVALVFYRNRWNIKHYIYLLRKRRNYQIINGQNFAYDAFVGYEAEDSAWVRRRLLPVLEDEVGLKLCIHERDFQPGVFINDNIVINMDKSAKVILVLTNAFARSGWCMFELKVAHSKLIEDETELVVILLEKIDGRNMNHSLKVLFDTTTYIEWTEDVIGQELFWAKLKNILKR